MEKPIHARTPPPATMNASRDTPREVACRKCEAITQPPAPSHPIARGRAGPNLLAQVLFAKYRAHLPLNRQSDIYANEGIYLDVSTLADWVGACAATLMPLVDEIRKHVLAAERIHADDTTVPVLARGKCRTGRLWTYVCQPRQDTRQRDCHQSCDRKSQPCMGGRECDHSAMAVRKLMMNASSSVLLSGKALQRFDSEPKHFQIG
jgi:transposase